MKKILQRIKGKRPSAATVSVIAFLVLCAALVVWDSQVNGGGDTTPYSLGQLTDEDGAGAEADTLPQPAEEDMDAEQAFFAEARLSRDDSRAEQLAQLDKIIADEGGSPALREEAEQKRLELTAVNEAEMQAENLLAARDFGEAVVLLTQEQATVMLRGELDERRAAQVAEIVDSVCGVGYQNIIIVNK
ncbi:MAG: SpoIIIAH-like family protein [Bacillota bacterium]|nr:SpoIIIAH-like family protein [Bacillota bacterium]